MPILCPCGSKNPDGSLYCNRCGKSVYHMDRPSNCPGCGHANPAHVLYCGKCGADLEAGKAHNVPSDGLILSESSDAYLKYGNSRSLFIWGATTHLTKTQYMVRLAVSLPFAIYPILLFLGTGHLVIGLTFLALYLGGLYFFWRIGREGANWGG